MSKTPERKVIIIGGGPAGLTAAIYCARAGLKPIVAAGGVNGGLMPGGQLMITTEVENYPGFPEGISGPDLMKRFRDQALRFGAEIIEDWVSECDFEATPKTLKIGDTKYEATSVIIATGAMARWLGLPGEEEFVNNGISACATCDGALPCFRNQHLHVVGGGDTAMEEALFLTRFASKVTVIHRRDELRASKVMQERARKNDKIEFMFDSVITGYKGDPMDGLEALQIENVKTGGESVVPTAGLFMAIGHIPITQFLEGSNIELTNQRYINSRGNVYTNHEGVFTCGDVHDTHYRQAVTAAGFGCMAAIACERYLDEQGL